MTKRQIAGIVILAVLGITGAAAVPRYLEHRAWIEERQTTEWKINNLAAGILKEMALTPSGETSSFAVRDGTAVCTVQAADGALNIVMDDKTQEVLAIEAARRFDTESTQALTAFHAMLSAADIPSVYVWQDEAGKEHGDPSGERVDALYALACSGGLIRGDYRIAAQTEAGGITEMSIRKVGFETEF